mgnify:CR=1 FL=1
MLTETEIATLNETDKANYLNAPEDEKEIIAESFRQSELFLEQQPLTQQEQQPPAQQEQQPLTQQEQQPPAQQEQQPKIETRGRKKLPRDENGQIIRTEQKPPVKPANEAETEFFKDMQQYKDVTGIKPPETKPGTPAPVTAPGTPAPLTVDASKFISGALFITVVDSILPGIILQAVKYIDIDYKYVKAKQIKLDKEQKAELTPLANEVVKMVFGEVNPAVALVICMGAMYYENISEIEIKKPVKKDETNS